MSTTNAYGETLAHVNTYSRPSDLRITDMRFAEVYMPMHCILMKLETNQGITGYGEVRDWADKDYALMMKSRLIGENPCDVDRIFRKIKDFGGPSRFAGGVCAVELALWDIAGKAYGVPVYQMLGGKFRDRVRMYCDTDAAGRGDAAAMAAALQSRLDRGFTFLKMDLGVDLLYGIPGALCAPQGVLEALEALGRFKGASNFEGSTNERYAAEAYRRVRNIMHHNTGIQFTEKGLDILEQYCADVRRAVGYDVPIAIDHVGHIGVDECIKLGRRIERFNFAWMEDAIPWMQFDQYRRLRQSVSVPIATGEDIYLKEDFRRLMESGGVSIIHPDILTAGGILEMKKISDMAQDYGVGMAVHMAESPIACLAAAHCVTACENFIALEFHSADFPWWDDLVNGVPKPIINDGYITLTDAPGLGIESLNEDVIAAHADPRHGTPWAPTDAWNDRCGVSDRIWS